MNKDEAEDEAVVEETSKEIIKTVAKQVDECQVLIIDSSYLDSFALRLIFQQLNQRADALADGATALLKVKQRFEQSGTTYKMIFIELKKREDKTLQLIKNFLTEHAPSLSLPVMIYMTPEKMDRRNQP